MNTRNPALEKIRLMQVSVRCAIFGGLALLPLIGVCFGVAAMLCSIDARRMEREYWNPARYYRYFGLLCAAVGLLVWSWVDTFIFYRMFMLN